MNRGTYSLCEICDQQETLYEHSIAEYADKFLNYTKLIDVIHVNTNVCYHIL